MSKKPIGLIISTIILALMSATFIALFIIKTINCANLEKTVKTQTEEITTLKEKITELEEIQAAADNENYDATKVIGAIEKNGKIGDHVRGKKNSKVVVIEYADLQCPGCASMMPVVKQLTEKYGDKVAFVYRHYPLDGHKNALPAAIAAEAAGKQGYFWEMLETLFEERTGWIYANGSGLKTTFIDIFKKIAPDGDVEQFTKDLGNEEIKKKINFDASLGREENKVTATPSFFVNGEAVGTDDITTLQDFSDRIEELIKEHLE